MSFISFPFFLQWSAYRLNVSTSSSAGVICAIRFLVAVAESHSSGSVEVSVAFRAMIAYGSVGWLTEDSTEVAAHSRSNLAALDSNVLGIHKSLTQVQELT